MRRQDSLFSALPADAASFWSMNGAACDYAENACRAWLEAASGAQERVLAFLGGRLARDSAFLSELGRCRTPLEAFSCEAAYLGAAVADFVDEGARMGRLLGDVARERMFGGASASTKMPRQEGGGRAR